MIIPGNPVVIAVPACARALASKQTSLPGVLGQGHLHDKDSAE